MSVINKINVLIEKLQTGNSNFIKKFQNDFIIFEKEYDKENDDKIITANKSKDNRGKTKI